jgi:ABC-type transport system substrate-binding protein
MNLGNRNSPLRNVNARKALSYAINRQELNRFLFNGQGVVTGNIFPSQLGNVRIAADPFSVNQARSFMRQSGADDLNLELNAQVRGAVPQMLQLAQTLQSYWRAIGVDVNIVYGDYGTWRAKAVDRSLAPNALELLDIGGRPDNSDTSIVWFSCGGLLTQACDRQMDIRAQRWSTARDDRTYAQAARTAERYIKNRYLSIPVLGLPVYYMGSRKIPQSYSVGAIALGFHVQGLVWNR